VKTITLQLPDSLNLDEKEFTMLVASRLYETGDLSLGQAAEMAGMTKRDFAESLSRFGVSIFNYPASDLAQDLENA